MAMTGLEREQVSETSTGHIFDLRDGLCILAAVNSRCDVLVLVLKMKSRLLCVPKSGTWMNMAPFCLYGSFSFCPLFFHQAIKVCMYLLTVKPLQHFHIYNAVGTCGQTKI